ncbi:potassium/proton antiporter [Thiocapsa rosea]|uniref:Sodium/proton antiporter (CPA1 family) n=1 Tax=Thiocapsa rosea TaxID=69360 RepID=A0A495V4F7_9GAMM|nr:potassium/proton antiporter [Thiocapsa rosea]RKT44199.1 sodium/proton antiporter (CPA1 family) [Thiocapsa rosea]
MIESLELFLLMASGLVLLSVLMSPLAIRLGAPILLIFLGIGMLVGQDGPGGYAFDDFELAYHVGSIALAVILFSGGLGTRVRDIRVSWGPALMLATFGVVITAAVVGVSIWLLGVSLLVALLLGAVIGSTDAAATFLLLQGRGIKLKGRVMETIVVESGLNDPMAIFLTIVLVSFVDAGGAELSWALGVTFALQLGVGAIAGLLGGLILAWLINRLDLASGLFAVLALSGAMALFGGTQLIGGSGYLAVYLCGVVLMDRVSGLRREELNITHGSLAWLSQILMFLMLGLLVSPHQFTGEIMHAAGVAFLLIFIARPLAVAVSLAPFRFSLQERIFISWVGLRGAVPIFLAIIPVVSPGPVDVNFFNVVFMVVIASLVLQGWTIPWLARRLDLEEKREAPASTSLERPEQ